MNLRKVINLNLLLLLLLLLLSYVKW